MSTHERPDARALAARASALAGRWLASVASVAAVLVVASGLAGCAGSSAPSPSASAPSPSASDPCDMVRSAIPCKSVVVGGVTHRYLLTAGPASADVVLVDLGGPGRSLLVDRAADEFAAAWRGGQRLLFVEEPWVRHDLSDGCREALHRFTVVLRDDAAPDTVTSTAGSGVTQACSLAADTSWGWSPATYRDVVEAAVRQQGGRLVGVVGSSFGAPRELSLWSVPGVSWRVLNSPAPVGLSATAYLQGRRQGALSAVAEACGGCDPETAVRAAADLLTARPVELGDRTPPVSGVDVAAAVVGVPYENPDARRQVVQQLVRDPAAAAPAVGRLSDAVLLRYGEYDMSPSVLAYYSEVCRQYDGWDAVPAATDPTGRLLARLHAPCRFVAGRHAPPAAGVQAQGSTVPACLASAADDFVTPASFTDSWLRVLPHAMRVRRSSGGHAGAAAAAACYAQLTRR